MITLFLPRGIRNNNPGNLRHSKTVWQGQSPEQTDAEFVQFATPVEGLRALMKTLLTYYLKYNLDTVESIINRFAPPHENATDAYIYAVTKAMGVRRTETIILTQKPVLIALAKAVVCQENGAAPADKPAGWYSPSVYDQAANLVLPPPV